MLGEHYAGIRRWAPSFLDAFVFQGVPAAAALMRAIDMLRDMNRRTLPSLPKSAPIGFIRQRWAGRTRGHLTGWAAPRAWRREH
jgi:hypothetical protein